MSKFNTLFNPPEAASVPTGDFFDKTYEMHIDKLGHKSLRVCGKTNRYAKVQAHKEETLIENILKRATLDPTILQQRAGIYGDFTDAPKTLAEAQTMMIALENTFNDLPLETREKFDFSLEKFISQAGSKEWLDIMNPLYQEKVLPTPEQMKESIEKGAEE